MRSIARIPVLSLALPGTADAIRCSEWARLGPESRRATVYGMIQTALQSSGARRYDVNVARVQQCLEQNATHIELDFDGACADSGSAGLQALNTIFKRYAWSCVQ